MSAVVGTCPPLDAAGKKKKSLSSHKEKSLFDGKVGHNNEFVTSSFFFSFSPRCTFCEERGATMNKRQLHYTY